MKHFSGLKNVIYMGLVSFFTDFSIEMVMSVLPLYIVKDLDLSRTILGAIEGSGDFVNYIFRIPSGYISDKIRKRKILVIIGYAISTISKPFFIFVTTFVDTIIVRIADRIGKEKVLIIGFLLFIISALVMYLSEKNDLIYIISIPLIYGLYVGISETVQRALVAKYVSEHNRGTAFGFYGLIVGICLLIGNVIFGFLWDDYDISTALLYSISLSTLAIISMFTLIKKFYKD